MGNCTSCMRERGKPKKKVTLAIFGLDNAGKTVTTKGLQGESLDTVAPTIGFSTVEFSFQRNDITLYDLGGGKRIRDIWKNYFGEIYGMIFVVDSTDPERMDECRQVLTSLLEDPRISGKPVLLLANKQDCNGAMDELDVCQHLNLEELVNINKCPCRVETCSAILGQGNKIDKSITNGLKWLMSTIHLQWEKLSLRIEKDVAEQIEREKLERKKRAEMVRKKREERERKEKEERRLRGEPDSPDETGEPTGFKNGNPFKPVDVDELTRQQQKLKEEKLKRKQQEELRKKADPSNSDDSDEKPAPKSSKSHSRSHGSDRQGILDSDDSDVPASPFRHNRRRTSHRSRTPSPENTPRLSRRKLGPVHSDEDETSFASKSPWLKKRTPRPLEAGNLPSLSGRINRGLDEDQLDMPAPAHGRSLMPIGHLEPLQTDRDADGASLASSDHYRVDSRRKKKKKRTRRNQISAAEDDDMKSDTASVTSTELTPHSSQNNSQSRGWGTPPGQRSLMKASRSPRLEAQKEEQEPDPNSFSQRWGLAEDLPDMPQVTSYRRTRPNMDSGEDIIT